MNEPKVETRPHIGQGEIVTDEEQGEYPPGSIGADAIEAGQALEVSKPRPLAVVNPNPLSMLASALEQGHDIAKLEKLMDMAERYEANEARKAFALALSKFQGSCPDIVENKMATVTMQSGGSYTYQYADLDAIMRTIRPTLKKCGLSVRYDAEVSDDGKRIRSQCYVMHKSGHTETTTFVVPVDEAMKVNDSQKMGSANAYACRYNVVNALGLTTGEDDDGGALHGDKRESGENIRSGSTPAPAKKDDLDEFYPIGKWKGHRWDDVPLDYLEWAAANLTEKPDIVAKCKEQITARLDSDDQKAQAEAGANAGEPTMAECARWITNAKTADELAETWSMTPEKHRGGLEGFHATRLGELTGDDKRGPEEKAPF